MTDQGKIAYLVDPGINGSRTRRDDGSEVRKFTAPKATLMAFITDGILQRRLPWTLVLLGVSISVVLELCGISSLAFAVGVYLPLSTSTPILVGGLVRYVADRWGRSAGAAVSETDADTSPGVLLSTGYIAGGAIAGVLIAFLNFSDEIPRVLARWQYREIAISREETLPDAAQEVARGDLGLGDVVPEDRKQDVDDLAAEIADLNSDLPPHYIRVPKGTVLQLGKGATYTAERDMYLGDVAQEVLGTADKSESLLDLNKDTLKVPEKLPAGARLKVPQHNWPALAAFGVLIVFLVLVGMGLLFRAAPVGHAPAGPDAGNTTTEDEGYGIHRPDEPQGEGRT